MNKTGAQYFFVLAWDYISVCICVCVCLCTHACMHACAYVYAWVYVHVCMCYSSNVSRCFP